MYHLHESLGFSLTRVARISEQRLDAGLKELGLTRTTWCVLCAVGNENLMQPSDIANYLGIDRTAISRALRQMQLDGFIDRMAGDDDGRTRRVRVTATGLDRLARGKPIAEENNRLLIERIGAEAAEDLKEHLDLIIEGAPHVGGI